MKKILIFILIASTNHVFAQKCKLEKNETDDFTGAKIKVTKYDYFNNKVGFSGGFNVQQNDAIYSLGFSTYFYSDNKDLKPFTIEQGQELIILLENKDTIAVKAKENFTGTVSKKEDYFAVGGYTYGNSVGNIYPLTASQFNRLKVSPIKTVRFFCLFPAGTREKIDMEALPKLKNLLINSIACIETN